MKASTIIPGMMLFISILSHLTGHAQDSIPIPDHGAEEWKLKKEKNGIRVHTREAEGTKFKAFKASALINAPMDWVLEMLMDVKHKKNWMADLQKSELLEHINDRIQIEYYESKVPGPFRDRDIVLIAEVLKKTSKKVIITYVSDPAYIPEKDKFVRIHQAEGKWELTALEENQTLVEYGMLLDPGGNIPAWIVNMFIVDGPLETMTNLKELTALIKQF